MGFGRIVHTRIDCEADSRSRCQALKDILIELEERIDHLVNEEGVFAGNLPTDVKIMTEDGDKKPSDLLKGMTSVDEDASLTFVASQDDAWVSAGVSGVLESGRAYTCAAATPDGKFYMGLRNKPADPDGLLELYEIVDDVVGARLSQTESSTFRTAIGNGAVMHPTGRYLATINTDAADGLQKLVITDLEDPTAPVIVGTLVLTAAPAAATQGLWDAARGVIYWPGKSGTNHVFVYDVSDPGNPLLASTYTTSGLTNCIAAVLSPNREFLYLAGNGGVESASIAADGTLTKDTTILLGGLWETLDHNGTSLATLKWASNAVINVLTIDIDDADEGTISTNTNNSVTGSYAEAAEMRNCSYVGNYLACPSGMEGVLSTEGLFLVFDLRNLDSVTEFSSTVPSTLDVTSVVAMGGPKNRKYVQLGVDADVQTWKVAEVAGGVDLSLETIRVTNLVVGSSEMVRGLNAEFLNGLPGPAYLLVGDGVEGPATSTDNAVPRFDGVTGSLLQDSGVTIDDSDNLDVPGSLTLGTVLAEAEGGTGVAALSSIDHGVFAGLLDNDHPQYPLISGTPANNQVAVWTGAQGIEGLTIGTNDQVLTVVAGAPAWADATGGGGASALDDLTDVVITSVADNEVLAFDTASGDWINKTAAEAGLAAASHNHAAGDITSGTLADARVAQSNVTQHQAALSITESQISDLSHAVDAVSNVATSRVLGRVTAGSGNSEELTATQVRTLINVADGANAYVHPNHSGDVTSVGDGAQTIAANVVTNAKAADMVAATIKGRASGAGTGDPTDLTAAQVRTIINVENGSTADQTAAEILSALLTVDGAGSGLDADRLDGNQAAAFPLISGTPADNQIVRWAGSQSQDGGSDLTWNGSVLAVNGGAATLRRDDSNVAGNAFSFNVERGRASGAVVSGDTLGSFSFYGEDGLGANVLAASMTVAVDGTVSNGNVPALYDLRVFRDGIGIIAAFAIDNQGNNILGGSAFKPGAGGRGMIIRGAGATPPSSMAANSAGFYSVNSGGTIKPHAIDEADGTAVLTPHTQEIADRLPSDPYPGGNIYTQPYLGIRRVEDITRALLDLSALTGEQYIFDEVIPTRDWHANSRLHAERAMAEYERHEARAAQHASEEAKHADAVTAWEALPSAEDTRRAEWEALPKDRNGERYRLAEARDDSGNKVRVRVAAPEPPLRELRRESVEMVADDGTRVRVPHLRERPPAPEPLQEAPPPLPVVKEPPDMILRQLIDLDRWDKAAHDALVAEVEEWKATR
jgi:hypothetical protein